MLDYTISTDFVPGTNLSGDLACADWRFLLPSLCLGDALCLGVPSVNSVYVLSKIARRLWVVSTSLTELRELRGARRMRGVRNLEAVCVERFGVLPFASGTMALIWIGGGAAASNVLRRNGAAAELERVLAADGVIYCELNGLRETYLGGRVVKHMSHLDLKGSETFWLTPLSGEARTAVPVDDRLIGSHFFSNVLYGQSPRSQMVSRLGEVLSRLGLLPHLVWRRGLLMRRSPGNGGRKHPPQYLVDLARAAGVDLAGFRFGFSAHGKYDSNKVVFHLFDPTTRTPEVVVKITRTPQFNGRLEHEYRMLFLLKERGYVAPGTHPEPLFFELCNGLALLGEKAARGRPFRRRTEANARCPVARRALDWITQLGKVSAKDSFAAPEEVAAQLTRLFEKFSKLYALSEDEHSFLQQQMANLGRGGTPFPLVFYHGDASTWNILVSEKRELVFLDWEAAEPRGMPLWDLFYFLYTFGCWVSRRKGNRDKLASFGEQFLQASPLSVLLQDATARYCEEVGLGKRFVEPLFYTCWMHRALRESAHLPPDRLEQGEYVNLLRLSIRRRHAPGLSALFGATERQAQEQRKSGVRQA